MQIEHIKLLLSIYETHSLSKTAELSFISQSNLSRILHSCEKKLNTQLFTCNWHGAEPTKAMEKIFPFFKQILHYMSLIEETISEEQSDLHDKISICSSNILVGNIFTEINSLYSQTYPDVTLDLFEKYEKDLINTIQNNQADIGILTVIEKNKEIFTKILNDTKITTSKLLVTPMVILTAATSPLAHLSHATQVDLEAYSCFITKSVKDIIQKLDNNTTYKYCLDKETRNKLILKNNGYTIVSEIELIDDFYLKYGLMKKLNYVANKNLDHVELWLIYKKSNITLPHQKYLVKLIESYFKNITTIHADNLYIENTILVNDVLDE